MAISNRPDSKESLIKYQESDKTTSESTCLERMSSKKTVISLAVSVLTKFVKVLLSLELLQFTSFFWRHGQNNHKDDCSIIKP